MARYVLLDGNNIVRGDILWDGVTPYNRAGLTKHLLPASPPKFREGDTYNPANDTVIPRPDTPEEAAGKNQNALIQKGIDALAANSAFLAIGSPSNAQTLAQVRSITRQTNALIRVMTKALDTLTDT